MTGSASRPHSLWGAGRRKHPAGVLNLALCSQSSTARHRPLQAATATDPSEMTAMGKAKNPFL